MVDLASVRGRRGRRRVVGFIFLSNLLFFLLAIVVVVGLLLAGACLVYYCCLGGLVDDYVKRRLNDGEVGGPDIYSYQDKYNVVYVKGMESGM